MSMDRKFLRGVLIRATDAIMLSSVSTVTTPIWQAAYELLSEQQTTKTAPPTH